MAHLTFLYVAVCFLCYLYTGSEAARQMFSDEVSPSNNLQPWPTDPKAEQAPDGTWTKAQVKIAYQRVGSYSTPDWTKITDGFKRIFDVTKGCIKFETRTAAPDAPYWHLHPLRITTDPVLCKTFNGKYSGPPTPGVAGQNLNMFGSTTLKGECLSQPRDTLRLILNLLGVANEYQRSDRDKKLKMNANPVSLAHESLAGGSGNYLLGINSHISILDDFDINSVTMVNGDRFTRSGETAFTRRNGSPVLNPISSLPASNEISLSRMDCETLNSLYECNLQCESPDFLPYEPVVSLKSLKPPRLFANLNCWADPGGEVPPNLGLLGNVQPEDDSIVSRRLIWSDNQNAIFKVVGPSSASSSNYTAVFLREKVATGIFRNSGEGRIVEITADDPDMPEGDPLREVIRHQLEIELNCLPAFSYQSPLTCAANQGPGTNATDCNTNNATTPLSTEPQACLGNSFSSLTLGPFTVIDPDLWTTDVDSAPRFFSMSVSIGSTVQPNWVWVPVPSSSPNALRGYIIKTDTTSFPVSSTVIMVKLSVADISSTAIGTLPDQPGPPDPQNGAFPVIKTLTAYFKVSCATVRYPYAALLRDASRFRL